MAKSGVFEGDRVMVVKAVELRKELQKLLRAIVEEDDVNLEALDRAQQMLLLLKELKLKKTADLELRRQDVIPATVPEEFKCPLSKKLMRDPVILSTGVTYDRPFIQNWLKSGKRTCPKTEQVLSHTVLIPNHLIREMITNWCKIRGIELPECKYNDEEAYSEEDQEAFISLLEKMSSTLFEQKEAAKKLRQLTKRTPSIRVLFADRENAVSQLVAPFAQPNIQDHPDLQEDIITTILNISIHDNNKKRVAETPTVIPILKNAVTSGTAQIRSNAAAALFTLCALDSNKEMIGRSGALGPLITLLDEGHDIGMKDAASAIFSMCILLENKARAVSEGAVRVIMKKIEDRMQVDELLSILAMLSTNQKAIEQMIELNAVPTLLSIIRESTCPRNKENCVAILHTLCYSNRSMWREMREEEREHRTLSQLAEDGTSRTKRKANAILERLNRAANINHSA
ncbi:U-box domain-containing protein 9-like [Salvia miltiorrhiza]|uniref:U-box domain-containing protein 9-like n=1 Tax=Salvia miltiorrhiza TaxID=226208 RepID=UPI0025AD54B3|nr:U-box domain-containing protein 9-like [Salvia miltiorrhiza]